MAFYMSVNEPDIVSQTSGAQRARAFVIAQKAGKGVEVDIVFFLPDVMSLEFYTPPGPVAPGDVHKALERAVEFCESMGFVMEEIKVSRLKDAEDAEIVEQCPLFYSSIEEFIEATGGEITLQEEVEGSEDDGTLELEEEVDEDSHIELTEEIEEDIELTEEIEEDEETFDQGEENAIELVEEAPDDEENHREKGKDDSRNGSLKNLLKKYKIIDGDNNEKN